MPEPQIGLDFYAASASPEDTDIITGAAVRETKDEFAREQADPSSVDSQTGDESVRSGPPQDVMDPTETVRLFESAPDPSVIVGSLIDEYKIPPFSVLDTRQGYWQDRKRLWLGLNIKSEVGRDAKLTYGRFNQTYLDTSTQGHYGDGSTSIFDPVLTEIVYRWLCPPDGIVLDPFAGGSVRGIVAACLGHPYVGIELRGVQVAANKQQGIDILRPASVGPTGAMIPAPLWIEGDSDLVLRDPLMRGVDLVFTCPPYADLEVYSEDPADLSNMIPEQFDEVYRRILGRAVECLNDDRFAVVVIANIRDRAGHIRDLVGLTNSAMRAGGCMPYNEAVLLNVTGTGPIRARKQFQTSRKLVKIHQMVMCYVKGDPRRAASAINDGALNA